jgi:hypothetical protein
MQAQYFKDPFRLDAYRRESIFLADINREGVAGAQGVGSEGGAEVSRRSAHAGWLRDGGPGASSSKAGSVRVGDEKSGKGSGNRRSLEGIRAGEGGRSSSSSSSVKVMVGHEAGNSSMRSTRAIVGGAPNAPHRGAWGQAAAGEQYRANLASLRRLVLWQFDDDVTVVPKESSHFAFFDGEQLVS